MTLFKQIKNHHLAVFGVHPVHQLYRADVSIIFEIDVIIYVEQLSVHFMEADAYKQISFHIKTNCEFNFPTFFRFDRLNSHLLLNRNSWKIPLKYFRKLLFCRHQIAFTSLAKRDDITILQEFYVVIHTIHFKNSDRKNRWLSKNIFVSYRPPLPFSK